jgi:hypothetical protein
MKNGTGKKAALATCAIAFALALGGCQEAGDGGGNEPDAEVQNLINLDNPQASAGSG